MKKFLWALFLIGCSQQEFAGKTSDKAAGEQIGDPSALEKDGTTSSQGISQEHTIYGKDGDGKPIIGLDPIFKTPLIGQDENGKPILGKGGLNDKGEPLLGKSEDGKIIIGFDDSNNPIVDILDKNTGISINGINSNGKVVLGKSIEKDALGNRIYGVDGEGKNIIGYDSEKKKPIVGAHSDGSFIYGKGGVGDDGKAILGSTSDGNNIIGYSKNKEPIVDIKDEVTGKSVMGITSSGKVILGQSSLGGASSSSLSTGLASSAGIVSSLPAGSSLGGSVSSLPAGALVDHPAVCGPRTFKVNNVCVPALPVFRWYQPSGADHFYTMVAGAACQGKNKLAVECGYKSPTHHGETVNEGKYSFEGAGWYTIENIDPKNVQIHRIYRLYNGRDHLYVRTEEERAHAKTIGYTDEGFF